MGVLMPLARSIKRCLYATMAARARWLLGEVKRASSASSVG
jgi:hypothetical protein